MEGWECGEFGTADLPLLGEAVTDFVDFFGLTRRRRFHVGGDVLPVPPRGGGFGGRGGVEVAVGDFVLCGPRDTGLTCAFVTQRLHYQAGEADPQIGPRLFRGN